MAPKKRKLEKTWQEFAKEAQDHRDSSLALVPGLPDKIVNIQPNSLPKSSVNVSAWALDPKDYKITQLLPKELVSFLARGELSAVDVTTAYLRRTALAQKLGS